MKECTRGLRYRTKGGNERRGKSGGDGKTMEIKQAQVEVARKRHGSASFAKSVLRKKEAFRIQSNI